MTRYAFALASPIDDRSLMARMAQDRISGDISVSFRREPSYFAGCCLQGEQSEIIKCVDNENQEIVGLAARHLTTAFVNGAPQQVGYLSDLRGAPSVRGGTLVARGYQFLRRLHQAAPAPFYFTVIFDSNQVALSTLVGGRAGLPEYRNQGRLCAPAIHLDLPKRMLTLPGLELRQANTQDAAALVEFLNREHAHKQFASFWCLQDLNGGFGGTLNINDFYLALRGGSIVAAAAAWDQTALRQTFVEAYSGYLATLRPAYNALSRVLPLKPLPAPGQRVSHFYLSAIAIEGNDPKLFAALLRHVYRDRRQGRWSYCIVSLHERDPLCEALDGYRAIRTDGRLFSVHFEPASEPACELDNRIPYVDLARA
ncbi:MAG TPA: hypothetical protein VM532_04355 [Burkholderiales bacterium]|nr:hypothetical protein [Burkholderiales bacterium]